MSKERVKKYLYTVLTGFGIIALSILFFFILFKSDDVKRTFGMVSNILKPFVYGAVISYLLVPVCNFISNKLQIILQKKIKNEKTVIRISETIGIFLSLVFAGAIIYALLYLVIPQVFTSIMGILEVLPHNIERAIDWIQQILKDNPMIRDYVQQVSSMVTDNFEIWINTKLMPSIQSILNGFSSGIFGVVIFLKNIFIGVIVAIYLLSNRVKFKAQTKKLLYSCLKVKNANFIVSELRFANKVFGGFISGKLLDSLIIGIICFVVMSILRMPYTMLISVIVGVTNIIPFFGPFIGAIPSALLIFMISPIQCFYFIIFVLILQQFDGNILGPKILGDSIGLDSFWVLFSILFFGGVYGFPGMVLGVPTFAVLNDLIKKAINRSLKKKELSRVREVYEGLQYIDEESGEYHYFDEKK